MHSSQQYEVTHETVGELQPDEVRVVHMPRETFLSIVDDLLRAYPELTAQLRPVAERMPRYPFRSWINNRGCGCVVGEYLVATQEVDELSEGELARRQSALCDVRRTTVHHLLSRRPNGDLLFSFGKGIEGRLQEHLAASGVHRSGEDIYDEILVDLIDTIIIDD